jgi:HPt (histidine-containing phosphotransfer) domain-containing protein
MDVLPIVDRARLKLIARGDTALGNEFLDELVTEATTIVERLGATIAAGDRPGVRDLAHNLKGMAAELGALRLRAAAAALDAELEPERWPQHLDAAITALADLRSWQTNHAGS